MFERQRWTVGAVAVLAVKAAGMLLVGVALCLPGEDRDIAWVGLGLMLAALPAVVITQQKRAAELREDERAEIHNDGYRLALEHVAQGLLTPPQPSDPRPGMHEPADNVVYLPRVTDAPPTRGANQGGRAAR
ncbi:hypothetical protein SAMN05216371_3829 [Streptomyces sp. TLI_053]|uniref:hypothetical protein n=1 Tax=Streptomyces sp. TLI_053 TaxID=1855352 RepID=UPI00087A6882|nr:hypothetical protein [Streptomyces sp. TLI_053]SDT69571.1 hypothetical protein SAMN05216371_3829 [Streptomyces sp. TLI_053]